MSSKSVLRWLDGRGWLVFSGGVTAGSPIRARALGLAAADGGVAYVVMGDEYAGIAEQAMLDMDSLGAPAGYLVDVMTEDDDTIKDRLGSASIIVVVDGPDLDEIRSGLLGAGVAGMQTAFENGAVVLLEGLSAMVFGSWIVDEFGQLGGGLEWLQDAVVIPGVTSVTDSEQARLVLNTQPEAIAIGVGAGSALTLGPDGEVETWGLAQVAIALGSKYSTDT